MAVPDSRFEEDDPKVVPKTLEAMRREYMAMKYSNHVDDLQWGRYKPEEPTEAVTPGDDRERIRT